MQLSVIFVTIATLATAAFASPVSETSGAIISEAEFAHWLATTDAELTFIGDRPNPLAKRSAQSTIVTYCTKRVGGICGGSCSVYNGGATCLDATGTNCIAATRDVGFCDKTGCEGNCNAMSLCGTPMGNGFCATPNTQSILVSSL
ncbi:hypothetical protein VTO73DRAFT_4684 [Trametes versicolor]